MLCLRLYHHFVETAGAAAMEKLGMRVVGERRVDYMSVGLCSLPSSLRQAPEGKWALAGARQLL